MYPAQFLPVMIAIVATFFGSEAQASSLIRTYSAPMFSAPLLKAGFKCGLVDGKLVCGGKKSSSKKNDDDDDDDKPKNKKKSGNICEGNNHCGAGETDLETPNKYKACCEPAGGFQTAPKEAEKCKFLGEVGTPPNCSCPPGTEFMGYKGCVKKVVHLVCCTGIYASGVKTGPDCYDTEAAARKSIASARLNGVGVTSIACATENR
jgi:hypothetical protein